MHSNLILTLTKKKQLKNRKESAQIKVAATCKIVKILVNLSNDLFFHCFAFLISIFWNI